MTNSTRYSTRGPGTVPENQSMSQTHLIKLFSIFCFYFSYRWRSNVDKYSIENYIDGTYLRRNGNLLTGEYMMRPYTLNFYRRLYQNNKLENIMRASIVKPRLSTMMMLTSKFGLGTEQKDTVHVIPHELVKKIINILFPWKFFLLPSKNNNKPSK